MSLERLVVEFDSDTRGLQRGVRDSKREMVGLRQVSGRLGLNRAFDTKQAQAQLRSLDKQMQRNAQQMQKYQKEADRLRSVIANPPKVDMAGLEAQYENTYRKLEAINNRIEVEKQKLSGLRERGTDPFGNFIGAERLVGEIARSELQIANLMVQSDKTAASLSRLESELYNVGGTSPAIEKAASDLSALENTMHQLELSNREAVAQFHNVERELEDVGRSSKNASFGLRCVATEAKKTGKTSVSPLSGISKVVSQAFKRIVIMATAYKLVRSAASYLMDGLKTNKQFADSLNTIKVNLAVAFQPIYDYVLPAINSFMQTLAKATTYIAVFINALFGKTYAESAAAAEELDNAKEAMEGYGSAASETLRQLAGFDKFNDITAQKSGGGAAKSALSGLNFKDAFVDSDISEIFDKVKPFADEVKTIINWVKDHLDEIKSLAKTIGALLLAWKISSTLVGGLSALTGAGLLGGIPSMLTKTIGLTLLVGSVIWGLDPAYTIANEGFNWVDFTAQVASWFGAGLGMVYLAGSKIGVGNAFVLGASIAMTIQGITAATAGAINHSLDGSWNGEKIWGVLIETIIGGLGIAGVLAKALAIPGAVALGIGISIAFAIVAAAVGVSSAFKGATEGWDVQSVAGAIISAVVATVTAGIAGALLLGGTAGFAAGALVFGIPITIMIVGTALFAKSTKEASDRIVKDQMSVDYDPGSGFVKSYKEYFGGENVLNTAQSAGANVANMFTTGFTKNIGPGLQRVGMQALAKQEAEKMTQGFKDGSMTAAELQALGVSIPQGVAMGIASGASIPQAEIEKLVKSGLVNKTAEMLDSHSPSQVFADFGSAIDDGLAGGIAQGANIVTDTLKGLFNSMITLTNSFVSRFTQGFNNSMFSLVKAANDIDLTPGKASFRAAVIAPITRLAFGGIAHGEVNAIVGDNFNARQDPEVISPLSDLQQMITAAVLQRDIAGGSNNKIELTLKLENGETFANMLIDPLNNTAKNLGYAPVFAPV